MKIYLVRVFTLILVTIGMSLQAGFSLEYHSNYTPSKNTNHAIAQFNIERVQNINQLFTVGNQHIQRVPLELFRTAYYLVYMMGASQLIGHMNIAYHEFGHGSRANAIGSHATYRATINEQLNIMGPITDSYFSLLKDLIQQKEYESVKT